MTLEEFMDTIGEAGYDSSIARLAVEDDFGNWTWVNLVDVEEGPDPFIRFFRDDDIPTCLGAPGLREPAGSAEYAATPRQAEDHATLRCRNPWNYECKMSCPGSGFWHYVEIDRFDEAEGFDVVVLRNAGEALNLLW